MLTACSNTSTETPRQVEKESPKSERLVVISSAEPAKVLPAFTTFSWNEGYSAVLSADSIQQENAVKMHIRNELTTYLKSKGYQYQLDSSKADVVLGFLFSLKDTMANKPLRAKFGLLPVLKSKKVTRVGYKEGTFMLTVLNADLKKVYWRSGLEGFVDFEKDRTEQNGEDLQAILGSMLNGFPKAGR